VTIVATALAACAAAPRALVPASEDCYVAPAGLTLAAWIEQGRALAQRHDSLLWAVADWLLTGVESFGDDARPYLDLVTQRDPATVKKWLAVARKFPSERRRAGLSISFHMAVASLPTVDADRLLEEADRGGWRCSDLARRARALDGPARRLRAPARRGAPQPRPTVARAIAGPASADGERDSSIRCAGCLATVASFVAQRALIVQGPSTIQRMPDGELLAVAECPTCQSTSAVSLAVLERPDGAGQAISLGGRRARAAALSAVAG
jgi:hypothetical protein